MKERIENYIKCADNLSEYFYIFITDGVKYHNVWGLSKPVVNVKTLTWPYSFKRRLFPAASWSSK